MNIAYPIPAQWVDNSTYLQLDILLSEADHYLDNLLRLSELEVGSEQRLQLPPSLDKVTAAETRPKVSRYYLRVTLPRSAPAKFVTIYLEENCIFVK